MGNLLQRIGKGDGEGVLCAVVRVIERREIRIEGALDAFTRLGVGGCSAGNGDQSVGGIEAVLCDTQFPLYATIGRSEDDGAFACSHVVVRLGIDGGVAIRHTTRGEPGLVGRCRVVAVGSDGNSREVAVVERYCLSPDHEQLLLDVAVLKSNRLRLSCYGENCQQAGYEYNSFHGLDN